MDGQEMQTPWSISSSLTKILVILTVVVAASLIEQSSHENWLVKIVRSGREQTVKICPKSKLRSTLSVTWFWNIDGNVFLVDGTERQLLKRYAPFGFIHGNHSTDIMLITVT